MVALFSFTTAQDWWLGLALSDGSQHRTLKPSFDGTDIWRTDNVCCFLKRDFSFMQGFFLLV